MSTGKRSLFLPVLALASLVSLTCPDAQADLFVSAGSPSDVGRVTRFNEQTGAFVSTFSARVTGESAGLLSAPTATSTQPMVR